MYRYDVHTTHAVIINLLKNIALPSDIDEIQENLQGRKLGNIKHVKDKIITEIPPFHVSQTMSS